MSDLILGLIVPGMAILFAVAALGLWLSDRRKTYILGFVVAPLAIGVSLSINHYAPLENTALLRAFANFCSLTACIAFTWAVCTRAGREVPLKAWLAMLLAVLAFNLTSIDDDAFLSGFFLVNTACGLIFTMGALLLWQNNSREMVDRTLLFVLVIVALQFVARPALVVALDTPFTATGYRNSPGHAMLIVSGTLLPLLMACAALAAVLFDKFDEMREKAACDPLTGLPLRRGFEEAVQQVLSKGHQRSVPVSLIIGDIDHFKQVNDLWGHLAGDRAIAAFGALIGQTIRETDRAGRIGGEEFCILVWNCNEAQAAGLAERLRRAFAARIHEGVSDDIRLTASFGVAEINRGEGYTGTFARADRALYRAKETGRDRVELASNPSVTRLDDGPRGSSIAAAA